MDEKTKQKIAMWRFAVLGPLVSARLEHGDRKFLFEAAAARQHELPDGSLTTVSARTVEDWYHAYRRGGFVALLPKDRADLGRSRAITDELADLIARAKQERPRRSIRRIIQLLIRARKATPGQLSHSSVHRLLTRRGLSAIPLRGPSAERRSFLVEHAGDLLVGDVMHGPLVIGPDGKLHKSYLISEIDAGTRYIVQSRFALSEGGLEHQRGFREAVRRHGSWRVYYCDHGSAYIALTFIAICARLGTRHQHAGVGDAEAKGVIERWHRTWRAEVGDELPDEPLPLAELNAKHWAWLAVEYHARLHDTTKRAPLEHWLAEVSHLRPLPPGTNVDELFHHREERTVRKVGTVRFYGRLLEVRPELQGKVVELRWDPLETDTLPRCFLNDKFVCDTVVQDLYANATRVRRRNLGTPDPTVQPTGLDPLALIQRDHYDRTRPVGAPRANTPFVPDEDED